MRALLTPHSYFRRRRLTPLSRALLFRFRSVKVRDIICRKTFAEHCVEHSGLVELFTKNYFLFSHFILDFFAGYYESKHCGGMSFLVEAFARQNVEINHRHGRSGCTTLRSSAPQHIFIFSGGSPAELYQNALDGALQVYMNASPSLQ